MILNNVAPVYGVHGSYQSVEPISYRDGALELEPPDEGDTLEAAPNGGSRAWFIVFSCAGISFLLSIMKIVIGFCLRDEEMASETEIDTETLEEIYYQLNDLQYVYAPVAAFVMILLGYRATVCIGAGAVMITLVILSYLEEGKEKLIKFLVYGPVSIGFSHIQLGVLIPVLEYFTSKRMKALFLSRLGSYVGEITVIAVFIAMGTSGDPITVKWRQFLRGCTGLCIVIGLLGLTLKELRLRMRDDGSATFVQRTLGLGKKTVLKNALFWCTCAVYFFYQWGIETPEEQFINVADQLNLNSLERALSYGLSGMVGMILGMLLAWMFKKVANDKSSRVHVRTFKGKRLNTVFGILAVTAAIMGIACQFAPSVKKFLFFLPFRLLFAASFAFCEGLRDDVIPEEFGRENVRITEGLIVMSAGLGGLITSEIAGEIEDRYDDDLKYLFHYGGGMLLFSTLFTSVIICLNQTLNPTANQANIHNNAVSPLRANGTELSRRSLTRRPADQRLDLVNNVLIVQRSAVPAVPVYSINPPAIQSFQVQQRVYEGVPPTDQNGGSSFAQGRDMYQTNNPNSGQQPSIIQHGVSSTGGMQPYQVQPGEATIGQNGGMQPYQVQPGEATIGQNGGMQPYQVQPGEATIGRNGGKQPYQVQQGVATIGQNGGMQPYQVQQGEATIGQNGDFQPYLVQQEGPNAQGSGCFMPYVNQQRMPTTSVNAGFQGLPPVTESEN